MELTLHSLERLEKSGRLDSASTTGSALLARLQLLREEEQERQKREAAELELEQAATALVTELDAEEAHEKALEQERIREATADRFVTLSRNPAPGMVGLLYFGCSALPPGIMPGEPRRLVTVSFSNPYIGFLRASDWAWVEPSLARQPELARMMGRFDYHGRAIFAAPAEKFSDLAGLLEEFVAPQLNYAAAEDYYRKIVENESSHVNLRAWYLTEHARGFSERFRVIVARMVRDRIDMSDLPKPDAHGF